jgi:hypothetical protein
MSDFDHAFENEQRRLETQRIDEIDRINRSHLRWRNAVPKIQEIFTKAAAMLREQSVPMECAVAESGRRKLRLTQRLLWELHCSYEDILLDQQGIPYRRTNHEHLSFASKDLKFRFDLSSRLSGFPPQAKRLVIDPRRIELDPEMTTQELDRDDCACYSWPIGVNGSGFPIIFDNGRDPSAPARLDIEVAKSIARLVHEAQK